VGLYLRHQTRSPEELHIIKEIAEDNRDYWRVVKLSESDKVSISDEEGIEDILTS
jgi:hypothetical protein